MHINHLSNELLLTVFSHLDLASLLPLELVCRRWRLLQECTLCEVQTLVLLGPTNGKTHNSTPLQLIQKSAQRYSVSVSKARYHVRLSAKGLTLASCELLLRKLPNISRLELVQVSLSRSVDLVVYLLNGWSLHTIKVLHDEKIHFATWNTKTSTAATNGGRNGQPKVLQKKYQQQQKSGVKFPGCLHTLLHYLTACWQPSLRHLTLVTFDSLSLKLPTAQFDLSQLTALHIIRPWETNRLLPQVLLSSGHFHQQPWTSLTRLTLYSDGNFSQLIRDYYDHLRPLFIRLTHLRLNFTSRTLLSLIRQNCLHLTHLALGCLTLPFVELALELEPLQFQLTHLELTFPYQCLPPSVEWSPLGAPHKVPLFITVRSLRLHFSTLLHSPPQAVSPILGHLFPKLETLTLERNKVDNPTGGGGGGCEKCARMRCITAFSCKHSLVKALRDAEMSRMRLIRLQVETAGYDQQHQSAGDHPSALQTYEVYCYKKRLWTIESTHF